MRASATPTGKSISVSVRVVRGVRAGGRGEAACERESGDVSPEVGGRRENKFGGGAATGGGGAAGAGPVPGGFLVPGSGFRVPGSGSPVPGGFRVVPGGSGSQSE